MNTSTSSYSGLIGPGQTLPLPISGGQFYFSVSTLPIFARPSGGVWCNYEMGEGDRVPDGFQLLEVQNPNKNEVVFQVIASSLEHIDKRQIPLLNLSNAPLSTFWSINNAIGGNYTFSVPDVSGNLFVDDNGVSRIAIQRQSAIIQNQSRIYYNAPNYGQAGYLAYLSSPSISRFMPLSTLFPNSNDGTEVASSSAAPIILTQNGPITFFATGSVDGSVEIGVSIRETYLSIISGFAGQPPS